MTEEADTYEKVAEVLANTIREAARLAGDEALALVDAAEKRGDAIVAQAEKTTNALREIVDRLKGKLKVEMKQLAEEVGARSDRLAEEAVSYIKHCEEASRTILLHHAKLNGREPPTPTAVADVEREIADLVATTKKENGK